MRGRADLILVNARAITLDRRQPEARAIAMREGRVQAVGSIADVRELAGPRTEVVDAEGGVAVPAFHDAHMHLLSYARSRFRIDCRGVRSLVELRSALAQRAGELPPGAWVEATGYDESCLLERRHPNRHDLDAAAPDHPVRLQHRSLHLDVLNSRALEAAGLAEAIGPGIQRDPATGQLTGRLYHAAELLKDRLERRSPDELARQVRLATRGLLAWGVTTVQDATITNGLEEWELFHRLAESGDLQVRVFLFPGARHWREVVARRGETIRAAAEAPIPDDPGEPKHVAMSPPSKGGSRAQRLAGSGVSPEFRVTYGHMLNASRVHLGPVKLMLEEGTSDPLEVRRRVAEVRAAGLSVALHAVSEAEVAIALDALRSAPPGPRVGPDRIEHGAVIPDEWLGELRAAGVAVVGQPALVHQRGDVYRAEYPPELHGWLHRAGSLLAAGILYAAGSDAPVTEPAPGLGLFAARHRTTGSGVVLGAGEALGPEEALAAFSLGPARAVGAERWLGRLRPGAVADVSVLDPEVLEAESVDAAFRPARLTIMEGRVVWRRPKPPASESGR